jgi:hypothetical protein
MENDLIKIDKMEIKLKNRAMCIDVLKQYVKGIGAGDIPYPRCCLCQNTKGHILGLYFTEETSKCTVFSICIDCWIKNRSEDGERLMEEKGELDVELMKKIGVEIEKLLKINLPNEILRIAPEELMN